ncbi:unnamed protein product [Amoebophrya sp. A120]|nr:unnamed protein product [Amoebophrya sp. A120]|eukprot:GSA120T00025548001.1
MGSIDNMKTAKDMEGLLKDFCVEVSAEQNMDISYEQIHEVAEIHLEEKKFTDNALKTADWAVLSKKIPTLKALAVTGCELEKIAEPEKVVEELEVLDLTGNKISDLHFLKNTGGDKVYEHVKPDKNDDGEEQPMEKTSKFPRIVHLTLCDCPNLDKTGFEEGVKPGLEAVKDSLSMLEANHLFGCKDEDELRDKLFKMLPSLYCFNDKDVTGEPVDHSLEEENFADLSPADIEEFEQLMAMEGGEDDEEEDRPPRRPRRSKRKRRRCFARSSRRRLRTTYNIDISSTSSHGLVLKQERV